MRPLQPTPHTQRGFTLLEALITVAIAAVLLAVGIPSFQGLMERNAVVGHKNSFIGSVNLARSEAMKRGASVVMCRSADAGTAANPSCDASGTEWKDGWIVFLDRNGNGQYNTAGSDVLLRAEGAMADSGGIVQSTAESLVFRSTGLMSSGASTFLFSSRSAATAQQRRVCVTLSGRTRSIDNPIDTCE